MNAAVLAMGCAAMDVVLSGDDLPWENGFSLVDQKRILSFTPFITVTENGTKTIFAHPGDSLLSLTAGTRWRRYGRPEDPCCNSGGRPHPLVLLSRGPQCLLCYSLVFADAEASGGKKDLTRRKITISKERLLLLGGA